MSDQFAPYADLFANPRGPGDVRPTALKVVEDSGHISNWAGRAILITGATSGIGLETARALFATGADVFITARDLEKGQAVVDDIVKSSDSEGKMEVIKMELTSLDSVKQAAKDFLAKSSKLNVLINNAGIMAVLKLVKTADGFEQQFGVNYIAHYTLTALLLPTLLKSSTSAFKSRVVSVTSSGHGFSYVCFDDINLTNNYDPWVAYGQSKTGSIWLANYIDRVYGPRGVHANAVHPGAIMTPLLKYIPSEATQQWDDDKGFVAQVKSVGQGAATTVWAAVADVWEGKGGKFLVDCGLGKPAKDGKEMKDEGYAPHAFDKEGEDKLWALSAKLTGVEVDEQGLIN